MDQLSEVRLEHASLPGTTCTVAMQGATIKSWQVMNNEMLFVSKQAKMEMGKKALRGGIPICFPQFGPGAMKQHGFARLVKWGMPKVPTVDQSTGDVTAEFVLMASEFTKEMWDYEFVAIYRVKLQAFALATQLEIKNVGDKPFDFTALLHTYLPIDGIAHATVQGLKGSTYVDKLDNSKEELERNDPVKICGPVDRIYRDVKNDIVIGDSGNSHIVIMRSGFPDIVLWNPWIEKSKQMDDFGDEEYKGMVCVEAGAVSTPITLAPGAEWCGKQGLNLVIPQNI